MFFAVPIRLKEPRPSDVIPVANALLIVANVLVYWLGWSHHLAVGRGTGPVSVIGYAFAHAGPWHLLGNMWVLLLFGTAVNRRLGNAWYLVAYLGTTLALGLFAWVFCGGGLVGASGAIFAVLAICALLLPAARVEVAYVALFPLTVLLALVWRPRHWVFWFVRWDAFELRAWWGLLLVPLLEVVSLFAWGWNWTNLGHLLGFCCGVAFVLLLPRQVSMARRPAVA
jgi:membrane associated rhomboid family serine protease